MLSDSLQAANLSVLPAPGFLRGCIAGQEHCRCPLDVLEDARMDAQAKKELLSLWASDACAVESAPAFRHLPGTPEPVSFDEVMAALVRLDGLAMPDATGAGAGRLRYYPGRSPW